MNRATKNDSWVRNPDGSPGFTNSPITGCFNGCPYCFARSQANGRLKPLYLANENYASVIEACKALGRAVGYPQLDPFYPRFWPERLVGIKRHKTPAGIFLCIMGEWAGFWVPRSWQDAIFETIRACPQHRFYLLTKQPWELRKFVFPSNVWLGVSVDSQKAFDTALDCLHDRQVTVKFVSLEPLLGAVRFYPERLAYTGIKWLIIGACTGTKYGLLELCQKWNISGETKDLELMPWDGRWTLQPQISWVEEIVKAADRAGVKVFLKDNLKPLFRQVILEETQCLTYPSGILRQELP